MSGAELTEEQRESMQESILKGLDLMGARGIAAGYLTALEERIDALERKVRALERRRK